MYVYTDYNKLYEGTVIHNIWEPSPELLFSLTHFTFYINVSSELNFVMLLLAIATNSTALNKL